MAKQGRGRKCTYNGITFDSIIEGQRYLQLLSMEQAGEISGLVCHPKFELQPSFKNSQGKKYSAITYSADFQYIEGGQLVIEDVKARNTRAKRPNTPRIPPDGRLRIKLFEYQYPHIKFIVKVM